MRPASAGEEPGRPEPPLAGLAREITWTYLAAGVAAGSNVAMLGFSLRRLSPVEFGTYAILSTITQLFTIIDFALSTTAVRAAAHATTARNDEEQESSLKIIRAVHACNLGLSGVLLAVTAGGCIVVAWLHGAGLSALTGLLGASISLGTFTAVLLGVATGGRCFRQLAVATLVGVAAALLVTVLFLGRYGVVVLGVAELSRMAVSRGLIAGRIRPLGRLGLPHRPSVMSMREIGRPAGSFLAISAAGLVVASTDILVLGVLSGSAVAGAYRVGSLVPAQVTGLLFRGYDAVFPLLAGQRDPALQTQVTRLLTRLFSTLAAAGLGAVALHADLVVRALSGKSQALSEQVLVAFCVVWAVNVVIHGPALQLLSRGGQALLARVVMAELVLNVMLTIVLVLLVGPIGAAWASLVAVSMSNLLLAPTAMRRLLGSDVGRTVWLTGTVALLAGAAGAGAGRLASAPLTGALARMSLTLVVAGACAGAALALLSSREERGLLAGSLKKRIVQPERRPDAG